MPKDVTEHSRRLGDAFHRNDVKLLSVPTRLVIENSVLAAHIVLAAPVVPVDVVVPRNVVRTDVVRAVVWRIQDLTVAPTEACRTGTSVLSQRLLNARTRVLARVTVGTACGITKLSPIDGALAVATETRSFADTNSVGTWVHREAVVDYHSILTDCSSKSSAGTVAGE